MICIFDELLFSLIKEVTLINLIYSHMNNLEDIIVNEVGHAQKER